MTSGDIPEGLRLSCTAQWNQVAEDWELFLRMSPTGCFVAVDGLGNVRGTVATVQYGDHFSWVGMVLVDPAYQRRGIGIQLLREALRFLSDQDTIKLDATPGGREVYKQLDFVDEYPIHRMEAGAVPENLPDASAARPIRPGDLPALMDIDREVFGADREVILISVLNRSPQLAWLLEDNGRIIGYCFGRIGYHFAHIGTVIADDVDTAKKILSAALKSTGGKPIIVDAPAHTPEWTQALTSLGFKEQRTLARMYRGSNHYPGIPGRQFAILGPEFG